MSLRYKVVAFGLILLLTFQSLHQINSYTYSTGISSFHRDHINYCFIGGYSSHSMYNCGETFHIN